MKIYIDNKKLKNDFYNSLTLPELLLKVKDNLDNKILKEIYVNGVEVNEKYLKESLLNKEDIEKVKFVTQKTEVLINNSLKEAEEYLPKLKKGVLDTANYFRDGKVEKANNTYQQVINGLEWYTSVISKILSIINNKKISNEYQKLIKDLNTSLTELMEGYNKDDIVLVADILEYEIIQLIDEFIDINNKVYFKFNNN